MFKINCPWCGDRAESEFSCGGEAGISRPLEPDALTDGQWSDYLFMRKNPKGQHKELWNHALGCRRWFGVERNTVTYTIKATYRLDEEGCTQHE